MSDAFQDATCVVCGQLLPAAHRDCPSCGASSRWQELIRSLEFAQSRFEQWGKDRTVGSGPVEAIAKEYSQQRQAMNQMAREGRPAPSDTPLLPAGQCWSCRATIAAGQDHCAGCGAPASGPSVQDLRFWTYTCHRIKAHCDAGRLPLAQAHAAMNDAKSRIAAMRNRLEKERVGKAVIAAEAVAEGGSATAPMPISRPATESGPVALPAANKRAYRRPLNGGASLAARCGKSSSIRARFNGCWASAACCLCSAW